MTGNTTQKQVYIWWSPDGVNMVPVTAANPLPVDATVVATNPSVGTNGATAPVSSTEIGIIDGTGKLQGVSSTNPLPISGTISASSSEHSTAAAPSYTEGSDNPLSGNLTGDLRVIAKQNGTWTNTVTQATAASLNATVVGTGTLAVQNTAATPAGTNVIGHVISDTGSTTAVTQPTASNLNATVVGTGTFAVQPSQATASNLNAQVVGPTASGSSLTANPVTKGGRAATTNPTAVADGQVVNTMHDKLGKMVAVGAVRILKASQKTTISNTTAETTIVTQIASTFCDVYGIILANSGATTTKVDIRDTTGGSIIATIEVPTLETRGFMLPVDSGFSQATVNTNWTAQCAAATTAMEVTAFYVKNT